MKGLYVMITGKKIAVIGAGNMGDVIVGALISKCGVSPENLTISDVDGDRLKRFASLYQVVTTTNNIEAAREAHILILAVKPQVIESVLVEISQIPVSGLVVSIAAGVPLETIEEILGPESRVVRVMPNTPAMVGEGASALAHGKNASEEDMALARALFESLGMTVAVDEYLMDAVTGLSGSGPAYCFIIIEALTDAGVKMGLPRDTALKLSAQTMLGSALLCLRDGRTPSQLKDMVTSPGGTTIEGIKALEKGALRATLMDAVEAAVLRSKALGRKKP
ncbi:MAG: pyrroline-5-carboxylate reductase [Syntrophales bacterium]|nr:pyrroline-5-carboxylate reductase [Syntrophales bacterium]